MDYINGNYWKEANRCLCRLEDIYSHHTRDQLRPIVKNPAMISAGVVALQDRGWSCSDASSALAETHVCIQRLYLDSIALHGLRLYAAYTAYVYSALCLLRILKVKQR